MDCWFRRKALPVSQYVESMKFRALVIEPVGNIRNFSVQAIRALHEFREVASSSSVSCALEYCNRHEAIDLCFLSPRLGKEECKSFISKARKKLAKHPCAFISVINALDLSEQAVGSELSKGTDGILCEPYSVDDLRRCLKVAAQMKMGGFKGRAKAGISFVLMSLIQRVHDVEEKDKSFDESDKKWIEMMRICSDLKALTIMADENYSTIISEIFAELEEKSPAIQNTVSRRLQEKFQNEGKTRSMIRDRILAL